VTRSLLLAVAPWLAALLGLVALLLAIAWSAGARLELGRLRGLHRDQAGGVQSLSLVLTLPLFVMVMMLIVQISQIMIGQIVVHYAAFAAARAAIVWLPSLVDPDLEAENRVSTYEIDSQASEQVFPILDPTNPAYGPIEGGLTFLVNPGSPKYEKIASAAVMACMPIAPSRNVGVNLSGPSSQAAEILEQAYASLVPSSTQNGAIPRRIRNKLAYAARATQVEIRFYHPNFEPPLICYRPPYSEFQPNELGWQDPITVTVTHQMALLPGPGRMLSRPVQNPNGSPDTISPMIHRIGSAYVYPLTASATLGNEGEKSVIRYEYPVF
jgi:hypothetical protein